jgi:hypothetical protein
MNRYMLKNVMVDHLSSKIQYNSSIEKLQNLPTVEPEKSKIYDLQLAFSKCGLEIEIFRTYLLAQVAQPY